jgi:hypothetical protein
VTGNASENAPMIAVNEMLGFEVVAEGTFWQKELGAAGMMTSMQPVEVGA